jgi:outer membrane protein OmpA-like peptidoglycan-associated protein
MRKLTYWVIFGLGAATNHARAQSGPQGADGSASGAASLSTSNGGSTRAAASTSVAARPSAGAPRYEPYEPGYPPEGNVLELGVFGGVIFPSADHNWRNELYAQREYRIAPELGARLGYYPTSFLGLEAEAMTAASKVKDTDRGGAIYAGRGHLVLQAPLPYVTPFLLVGAGRLGAVSDVMSNDHDPAWHFGIGAKAAVTHALSVRLDLRDNLTRNTQQTGQTQSFEVLLGLSATIERTRKEPPPPPADTDRDGFYDRDDKCPNASGVAPDGCPADSDSDGVLDQDDYCPREVGPAPKGCPIVDPDPDKDGVPLPCDACPTEPGVKPDGCPIRDTDKDGIFDDKDKCPNEPETRNGFEDKDGCPDTVPDVVKKFSGVVEGIYFDQGKATIRPQSKRVLANADKVLKDYPSISLEILGHTSSEGDAAVNQRLSQERADAVKQWLVDSGIPPERLKTRGMGPDEPLANNQTAAGREKNRRIEFRVVQ